MINNYFYNNDVFNNTEDTIKGFPDLLKTSGVTFTATSYITVGSVDQGEVVFSVDPSGVIKVLSFIHGHQFESGDTLFHVIDGEYYAPDIQPELDI